MMQRVLLDVRPHHAGETEVRLTVIAAGAKIGTTDMSPDDALSFADQVRRAALLAKQQRGHMDGRLPAHVGRWPNG